MTTEPKGMFIRPLEGLKEYQLCVALQEEVWGSEFAERVPVAILMVARRLGGIVAGAFDSAGNLLGFVFGMTGPEEGRLVHWSDMLAVRASDRGRGIGRALKHYQRERLREAGVDRVYWTFDPLEARNGRLNLGHLGAVAREYVVNMYGDTGSPLHGGIETDRLVVHWDLDSRRVHERLDGRRPPPGVEILEGIPVVLEGRFDGGSWPRPVVLETGRDARRIRVQIPSDIQALGNRDRGLVREWREVLRETLAPRLESGWEVRECIQSGEVLEYLVDSVRE